MQKAQPLRERHIDGDGVRVENWGLIPYAQALEKQLQTVAEVSQAAQDANTHPDQYERLILCTHPPVVTLGRGTKPDDVTTWQGDVIEVSRGGRATYHGPSQVVVYPILNLNFSRYALPARDLHAYMRALELAIIATLKYFDIESGSYEALTGESISSDTSFTGVWVKHNGKIKKIASIGIAVKKWISYHGLALNVLHDDAAHKGLRPCGFQTEIMTSMEEILDKKISEQEVSEQLTAQIKKIFL